MVRSSVVALLLLLAGCAGISRQPVPESEHLEVTVLGRHDLRFWGDREKPESWTRFSVHDPATVVEQFPGVSNREHHYLAISGGGSNGAYGAGLLVGWTKLGTRPEFSMVTGISTGALTAPFAYLGSDYDDELQQVYTTLDTAKIFRLRSIFNIFGGDAVVDVEPLEEILEQYISDEVIAEIAAEHRTGRVLLVGTSNLDAGRPVYWNIGRIADSGHPAAPKLIRQILIASASIPGAFPPVYIEVQGPDGSTYDEMHVDGGTSAQVFLYPSAIDWTEALSVLQVKGRPTAYVLRNAYIDPEYEPVEPRLAPILGKTVSSLLRNQGVGDVYRIYALAERDGVDVKLTWIPKGSVAEEPTETFDPVYMQALFEFGYERMLAGEAWASASSLLER